MFYGVSEYGTFLYGLSPEEEINIINYVKTSNVFKIIARFEFLSPDEDKILYEYSGEVIGGSITKSKNNGVRRSCSIDVQNGSGTFIPNPQTFWIQQKFKLYLGYEVNGQDVLTPQGVYVLRNPSIDFRKSSNITTITGIDKFSLLDGQLGGRLEATYSVPLATSISTAMRTLLSIVGDDIDPILDIGSDTTPYTLYVELGGTYADVLSLMANMLAYNMYYDKNGVFRCEPDTLDNEKASSWDYTTGEFHYQGSTHNYLFDQAYNAVKVVGDNVNGDIATGYAENTNPSSYFSIDRTGGVPILAPIIDDPVIPDDTYAQARAEYELKKYIALQEEITLSSTPIVFLEEDELITLTNPNLNIDRENYIINSISMPFGAAGGTMNISAVKASLLL